MTVAKDTSGFSEATTVLFLAEAEAAALGAVAGVGISVGLEGIIGMNHRRRRRLRRLIQLSTSFMR